MSTTSEIVERLNELAQNEAECGFKTEAYDLRAAAARLAELERENARLRSLCAEAAALYSQGGVFPINGEMSERLRRAALAGSGEK